MVITEIGLSAAWRILNSVPARKTKEYLLSLSDKKELVLKMAKNLQKDTHNLEGSDDK